MAHFRQKFKKTKEAVLMFLSCNVKAKWSSRGAVFFNKVALYNFTSVRKLTTTALGIRASSQECIRVIDNL